MILITLSSTQYLSYIHRTCSAYNGNCISLKYTRWVSLSYIFGLGNGSFLIHNTSPPITVPSLVSSAPPDASRVFKSTCSPCTSPDRHLVYVPLHVHVQSMLILYRENSRSPFNAIRMATINSRFIYSLLNIHAKH